MFSVLRKEHLVLVRESCSAGSRGTSSLSAELPCQLLMRTCLADQWNLWQDESGSVTNAHAHSFLHWLYVEGPITCTLSKEKGGDRNDDREGSWVSFPGAAVVL